MVDLKDLIKWFVPCFHVLVWKCNKNKVFLTLLILILFFDCSIAMTLDNNREFRNNISDNVSQREDRSLVETGRTFGRPFKKMMAGLLPVIFQLGAASTWAVIATLIGFKTLLVSLAILKLLLLGGALKLGALFGTKQHHHEGWSPQKEVHLHIHNGGHHSPHEEYFSSPPWSREGSQIQPVLEPKLIAEPNYGPQTISTPYGNYVKVDSLKGLIYKREATSPPTT